MPSCSSPNPKLQFPESVKWKRIVCLVAETKQPHPIMGWGLFCICKPGGNEEGRVGYPWAAVFPWEIGIIPQ